MRGIAGDRPPRYDEKNGSRYRRARACPSPCIDREGKRPWSAFGFRVGRAIAGDRPPRYDEKNGSRYRRARACPSPCIDREGKWPWLAFGFCADRGIAGDRPPRYGPGKGSPLAPFGIRRSRTTDVRPWLAFGFRAGRGIAGETRSHARVACEGLRATGPERVFLLRRSGSGDPELQTGVRFSRRSSDRGGQAPALRWMGPPPIILLIVKILQILLLSGSSCKSCFPNVFNKNLTYCA